MPPGGLIVATALSLGAVASGPFGAASAGGLGVCVANALRPAVRTLDRPIDAYHYTTTAKLGLSAGGEAAIPHTIVKRYLTDRVGRFWNLGIPTARYEVVGGLHVASDPVISRLFGGIGTEWALVQIPLPRGFRFVDIRSVGDPARAPRLPTEVASQLAAHGCATRQADHLLTTLASVACRRIAVETLLDLNVDGVLYDYPRMNYGDCPNRPDGAFILLRTQAFELGEVKVFTNEPSADSTLPDRLLIRQAFLAAQRAGSVRPAPWPDLAGKEPPTRFPSWAAERLFGCGPHPEDAPSPVDGEEPVDYWTALSRRHPESAGAHFQVAEVLAARGRTRAAIDEYRRALQLESDFAEALRALAWIHATSEDAELRDPAEAVRLATRLVEIVYYRPLAGRAWPKQRMIEASLTLATADAAAGNLDRAIAYAVQAVEASSREDADAGSPLTARTAATARRMLDAYRARAASTRRSP